MKMYRESFTDRIENGEMVSDYCFFRIMACEPEAQSIGETETDSYLR